MNREERKRIIENYYPLVDVVIDKLLSLERYKSYRYLREDLVSEGYIGLIYGIDTYDKERGTKPVSYFSMCIRGRALNFIKKHTAISNATVYIEDTNLDFQYEEGDYDEDWVTFVDKYEPEDELEKRIYHEILMGSSTYQELATDMGLPRGTVCFAVHSLKKKLIERIREEENYEN